MKEKILPDVHLRAIEPEDLDFLYTIENDTSIWSIGNTNVPYSRYTLHDYVANASGDIYTDKQVRLMIEDEQQTVVGIIDLVNFDPRHLRAEVSIVIQQPHRRKGWASAALKAISTYALKVLHLHQLYAVVDIENKGSVTLFETVGFKNRIQLKEWLFNGHSYHDAIVLQKIL